uniref:Cysteine-rich DPF motif domain-containing protein 1 n=1 Tax=Rodentolepis nana TaxID=102285 RepID=A0A0R3THE4_RODNA
LSSVAYPTFDFPKMPAAGCCSCCCLDAMKNFFPGIFIQDLERSIENTSSNTAENEFIKGLPKDDSWDYELKQP